VNATDLLRYKRLLLAKLDELSAKHALGVSHAPGAGGPEGDFADQATADAEADLHIRLHQSNTGILQEIEYALARIVEERFSICEMCSSPISKARLEALPWTHLCRDCKEREQSAA
jgi:DnaK suppressor protein